MRLTDAAVAIRPRSAWEALDLGTLLARRHAGLLIGSWAVATLPLFALISLLLWNHPGWAVFIMWWLKPAFERLPLFILSRALFGDTPRLGEALRAFPRLLKPQLLASLLWRRFSPTRSFDLPVLQLEGLRGAERSKRLSVLAQRNAGAATWLTLVGMHLELALWLGLLALAYLLLPHQWLTDWKWQSLLHAMNGDWTWLEHLTNWLYALVLLVWEPIYVACGFTLYLNRRTELEAWDIELVFRRLRQRLIGTAYALLLGLGALLALAPVDATRAAAASRSCPLPDQNPNGPNAPRLNHQALSSEASRHSIEKILAAPPFRNSETVTRWRLGEEQAKADKPKPDDDARMKKFFEALSHWKLFNYLADIVQILLWALLLVAVAILIWRYREWLSLFASRLGLPHRAKREAPMVLFGLELAPESLPNDIASEAERLWDEQPRAALSLLYRALLSRLLHDYRLPLKASLTEGEVLHLVHGLQRAPLNQYSEQLTQHWQRLAYGHQRPAAELRAVLCDGWRQLLRAEASA